MKLSKPFIKIYCGKGAGRDIYLFVSNIHFFKRYDGNDSFSISAMDKLVIRKATAGDREAVLKIHDHVYDGHDYLPAYYDHFLSSSDFIPFVMVYDGKIVSSSNVDC